MAQIIQRTWKRYKYYNATMPIGCNIVTLLTGSYISPWKDWTAPQRRARSRRAVAGLIFYLTVFATGLAIHFHWITLAPYQSLEVLGNPWIVARWCSLSARFFADKIPWVDSIWDAVHTVIRRIGGALLAIQVLGHPSPAVTVIVRVVGGRYEPNCAHRESSDTAHQRRIAGKLPFSNIGLSLGEDAVVWEA